MTRRASLPVAASDAPAAAMPTAVPVTDAEIYDRMVRAIRDHQLPPGTKLVADRLATTFGVSRTRIQPVLVRLASEQVVVLTPNRGATVSQPTAQEAREVFEVRRMIEPRLTERFIERAQPADIAALRRCIDGEEIARTAGDVRRAIRLLGDFHLEIADRAGHDTLTRILRELVSRTSLILMTYSAAPLQERNEAMVCGCREHRALFDAIRLGDAREASRLMHAHLLRLEAQLHFPTAQPAGLDLEQILGPAR